MHINNLIYPIFNAMLGRKHERGSIRYLDELKRSQYYGRTSLEEYQLLRLKRLITYAKQYVPYYYTINSDVLDSPDLYSLLAHLPVLTKKDIRIVGEQIRSCVAADKAKCSRSQTGGSTGEPLQVLRSFQARAEAEAAMQRFMSWAGVQPGQPIAYIKAHGRISWLGKMRQRALNRFVYSSILSDQHLSKVVIPNLKAIQPAALFGYPTSLLSLTKRLNHHEIEIPIVFSTGEMLYPHQRKAIEEKLNARVFDYNGSNEVEGIAFECEHGSRHITDEQVIVEIINNKGKLVWDEPGRILVTDLRNKAMPFIRYELGDQGVLTKEPCPCGRTLTVLRSFEGRTQDAIRSPDGTMLSGVMFAGRFRFLKTIKTYQVVQISTTEIEIRFVPSKTEYNQEIKEIKEWIVQNLGPKMIIRSTLCDNIALTRSGKSRLVMGLNFP